MPKISLMFEQGIVHSSSNIDINELRKARRIEQVRNIWKGLVDPIFLQHTNSVFIFNNNGEKEMHVYVDDSIFAAELNAQREIIKWRCLKDYGEEIDKFLIHVSKGRYKSIYPFLKEDTTHSTAAIIEPLSEEELDMIEQNCEKIQDKKLREVFKIAMINDLKWKK